MKLLIHPKERGQALIMIAFAAIALFAITALAIDGSIIFSDRRHAQNAADTSALAAALAKTRGQNYSTAATTRAASNGYDNNGTTNVVEVYLCNDPAATCTALPTGANPTEYIQVKITSHVKTYFARVIGWREVINHVNAVAHASTPEVTPWFNGKALVSTMEGCKGQNGDNNNPFTVGGNGTTIVNSSGIFVNSDCANYAFIDNGSSNSVTTTEGVCVVGGIQPGANGISPAPTGNCGSQIDPAMYKLPNPDCGTAGSITGSGGDYEAWPGYFDKTGNKTFPDSVNSGTLKLHKGIYCLYNGMSFNGNLNITTDVNENGVHDSDEGVFFYVPGGDVTFNGGSDIFVHAINTTDDHFPSEFVNYLLYVPPTNAATVTITGNNGSSFTGTILAPTSHTTLNGSGNAFSLDAQVISYDTTITGGGTINITYNQANQATTTTQPGVEVNQ